MKKELSIGIVGAGGFASFAAKAFIKVEGIRVSGISDIVDPCARQLASEVNAKVHLDYQDLLKDESIQLIYIATPPSLHYIQSKQALEAGKHVICEKPAALKTSEAEELAAYAHSRDLLYAVNLMQRYNPLYEVVNTIIREKWLGDFVHGFFENYASDEKLIPEHWFWDIRKSGGIFIEHGVHFFDMFQGWFGSGEVIHALEIARSEVKGEVIDRVQAVVLYDKSPVNFYHGFNQPKVLDRQELRLQFDRGDITLYEWVPVKIRLHGLLTSVQLKALKDFFPDATIEIQNEEANSLQNVKGKFKEISYDALVTITSGNIEDKMGRYEELVISMIKDQWNWILDRTHRRVIDDTNAVESLRTAEEATTMATRY